MTNRCNSGRIGSIVMTPAGGSQDEVAIRVVTGVGKSLDACAKDNYLHAENDLPGTGCIVEKRELAFVEHKPLLLPVLMEQDCINIPCDSTRTCVGGRCVSAKVTCEGDHCGLSSNPDGGGGAGGADASAGTGGASGKGSGGTGAASGGAGPVDGVGSAETDGDSGGALVDAGPDHGDGAEWDVDGSGCAAHFADCDLRRDDGCETDLTTTSEHCGRCGHDCLAQS